MKQFFAVLFSVFFGLVAFGSAQQPQTQTAPIMAVNAKYTNGVAPGYRATAGSGLTLNISAGTAFCGAAAIQYAGGSLTLTASATNYVYLDPGSSCAPAFNTTGFAATVIPLATVVAGSSSITSIADDRTMFVPPGQGVASVPSVNGISTAVTIAAGSGTSVNTSGSTITISTTGGGSGSGSSSTLPESTETQGGGANFFGDSVSYTGSDTTGCASGDAYCNSTQRLVKAAYGNLGITTDGLSGFSTGMYGDSSMVDCENLQVLPNLDYSDSGAPDTFIQCSEGDGLAAAGSTTFVGIYTNVQATHQAAVTAIAGWAGSPHYAKIEASNSVLCVQSGSGSWSADNQFHSGVALQTTTTGAVLTCTTAYPISSSVIAAWHVYSGGTATAIFAIDGTTTDTWNSGAAGTIGTIAGGSTSSGYSQTSLWWGALYNLSTTPSNHTFTVTVTNAGSGNPFSVVFFTSPQPQQNWLGLVYPRVFFGGTEPTISSTYSTYLQNIVSVLQAGGWANVNFVNLQSAWPDTTIPFAGGTYSNGRVCTASTAGSPHPGNCGHLFNSWAYLKAAGKLPAFQSVASVFGRTGAVTPQSGDYTASQVTNAADVTVANQFNATQTFRPATTTGTAVIEQGATGSSGAVFVQVSGEYWPYNGGTGVFPSPVTVSNTILAFDYSTAPGTPTDSLGNAFSLIATIGPNTAGTPAYVYVYAAPVIIGGSDTISGVRVAQEYTNLGSGILDGTPTSYICIFCSSGPNNISSLTTSTSDLILTGWVDSAPYVSATMSVNSPWVIRTPNGSSYHSVSIADQSDSSGTYTATWTGDGNTVSIGFTMALQVSLPSQTGDLRLVKTPSGTVVSGDRGSGLPYVVPQLYANAPACGSSYEGTTAAFQDSSTATPGATISGGGTNHIEGYCNGTAWVVK